MLNALPPDDYLADLATRYYEGCLEKVKSDENAHELLALLTEAIRIAPSDCPTLIDSHMLRAEILIKSENYEVCIISVSVKKKKNKNPFNFIHLSISACNYRFKSVQSNAGAKILHKSSTIGQSNSMLYIIKQQK